MIARSVVVASPLTRALAGTAVVLALLVALQAVPPDQGGQRGSDVLQTLLALGATAASLAAAFRDRGPGRQFWLLLAMGTGFWAAGQLLFTIESSALAPDDSSGLQRAFFLLAAAPIAIAGMLRPDRPVGGRALAVFDATLLAGLVLFLYFYVGVAYSDDPARFAAWRQLATLGQWLAVAVTVAPLATVSAPVWQRTYR
jgi:hypothetical protein